MWTNLGGVELDHKGNKEAVKAAADETTWGVGLVLDG